MVVVGLLGEKINGRKEDTVIMMMRKTMIMISINK